MIVHHRHQFQNALMRGPVSVLSRLQARPVLDREGNPLVIEGERMLAAKVQARDGRILALLIPRDPAAPDPYVDRAPGLRRLALSQLTAHLPAGFESFPDGVEVDGMSRTVTAASWLDGPSLLDAAVRLAREGNSAVLRALAAAVARALNDFRARAFAHDALNPGNAIVVSGGALAFTGLAHATWDGGPGPGQASAVNAYRHPDGDGDPFAEDAFAGLVLYASLLVLADRPALLSSEQSASADATPLVFGSRDLADPGASPVFARAMAETSPGTVEVIEALREAAIAPATDIDRWAAVMPEFRRIDVSPYLRSRPDTAIDEGREAEAAWAATWSGATPPEQARGRAGSTGPAPDPWEAWRSPVSADRASGLAATPSGAPQVTWPSNREARREPEPAAYDLARAAREGSGASRRPLRLDGSSEAATPPAQAGESFDGIQQRRRTFFAALGARDEATVRAMWPELGRDPVGRTATLAVQELIGRGLRERIRAEQRKGRGESAMLLADSASAAGIPIEPDTRHHLRSVKQRAATRERLDAALRANDLDELADLAVSGELLALEDTDRPTVQRVLRALKWPALVSALATDDDQIIVDAFDPDLWEAGRALSPEARSRVGLAMARVDWRVRVRQALRERDAEALETLFQRPPAQALDRLSASERRRSRRLIEQRHALAELNRAVAGFDDDAIVRALNHVERVGARITDRATWAAIQQIVERTSMVEDVMAAVDAVPMDIGKLAHLVPAARTMGYDRDPRLRGPYALDVLERELVRHAHLRRVRAALEKGDAAGIVLVAVPDPYGSLDLLTDAERSRIAQAIHERRRIDRQSVAARFRATPAP